MDKLIDELDDLARRAVAALRAAPGSDPTHRADVVSAYNLMRGALFAVAAL